MNEIIFDNTILVMDISMLFNVDFSDCNIKNFRDKFINFTSPKDLVAIVKRSKEYNIIEFMENVLIDNGEIVLNISLPPELSKVKNCISFYIKQLLLFYKVPYSRLVVNLQGLHINKTELKKEDDLLGAEHYVYDYQYPLNGPRGSCNVHTIILGVK